MSQQHASNSELAKKAQKILKDLGLAEVKLGHCHELFARLLDQPTQNHAAAKDVQFAGILTHVEDTYPLEAGIPTADGKFFDVKVVVGMHATIELKKYFRIHTTSKYLADKIVSEYLRIVHDQDDVTEDTSKEVRLLLSQEDPDQFKLQNWELIWNEGIPEVEQHSGTPMDLWDFWNDLDETDLPSPEKNEDLAEFINSLIVLWNHLGKRRDHFNKEKIVEFFLEKAAEEGRLGKE